MQGDKMNYLIYGEESYLMTKKLKEIIKNANLNFETMNLNQIDCSETSMEEIISQANNLPFFDQHKVIVLKNLFFLTTKKSKDYDLDALFNYFKNPNPQTILIFYSEDKLDERKTSTRTIKKNCQNLHYKALEFGQLKLFLQDYTKENNITIDRYAIDKLINYTKGNLSEAVNELDKLALYDPTITKDMITSLVARPLEDNVFNLVSMIITKQKDKAIQEYLDLLTLNTEVIMIITLIANQLRLTYQAKRLKNIYSSQEIAKRLGVHPFAVKKALEINIDYALIPNYLKQLADLDYKIKSGQIDKKIGLELFILNF